MIAALFALLLALVVNTAPMTDSPAPPQTGMGAARVGPEGGRPHSGAATAAPPPVVVAPAPAPRVTASPAPAPGEYVPPNAWHDVPEPAYVAHQLPEETLGRAID